MWIWGGFLLLVIICLVIDLGVLNKDDHVISTKEAGKYTAIWVSVAILFGGVIWWLFSNGTLTGLSPTTATLDYYTGYLVELSLSIDNVFVIAVIFSAFKIPPKYQHRVLFWGILGAIVFRGIMIFFGVALISRFDWMMYVFGAFLLYTAYSMLKNDDDSDPKDSWFYKQITKYLPVTDKMRGHDFFIHEGKRRYATPLFVALIIIELTDVMFALDSIPAVLAITQHEYIVFTSNILAILGLRSLFFLIVGVIEKFRLINYSLAIILAFVGLKMIAAELFHFHLPSWLSLLVIAVALAGGIVASIYIKPKEEETSL